MKTWQMMWHLVRFRPWLYLSSAMLWNLVFVLPLVPGLITREIFNRLTGNEQAGIGLWSLIALLVAVELVRRSIPFAGSAMDATFQYTFAALLRKNLFERVLQRP